MWGCGDVGVRGYADVTNVLHVLTIHIKWLSNMYKDKSFLTSDELLEIS